MLLIVGLGLAGPFAAWPVLHTVLKWVGGAWLLVLAWKIARAGAPGQGPSRPPLGFIGAALFQWVNPKAWMIALAAIPAFTTPAGDTLAEGLRIAAVFAAGRPALHAGLGGARCRRVAHPAHAVRRCAASTSPWRC